VPRLSDLARTHRQPRAARRKVGPGSAAVRARQQPWCVVMVTRFGTGDRATTSRHSLPAHVSIEYRAAMAPGVERSAELNVASCELGKSFIDFEKSPELIASTVAWL